MVTTDVLLRSARRYPADPFDRIWSSPRIPEGAQFEAYNRTEDANLGFGGTNIRFPIAVMRSIWRGKNLSSTMNFEVNVKSARALRPLPTFWFQMLCSNVVFGDVNPHQSVRLIDGDGAWVWGAFEVPGSPGFIQVLSNDQVILSDSFTIRIEPNEPTEAPVLVNAAEIHGEFAAVAVRTSNLDGKWRPQFALYVVCSTTAMLARYSYWMTEKLIRFFIFKLCQWMQSGRFISRPH